MQWADGCDALSLTEELARPIVHRSDSGCKAEILSRVPVEAFKEYTVGKFEQERWDEDVDEGEQKLVGLDSGAAFRPLIRRHPRDRLFRPCRAKVLPPAPSTDPPSVPVQNPPHSPVCTG